jgi:hypothetical protein
MIISKCLVDLAQGLLVHLRVVARALVLDVVARVVLHARPDILLDAGHAGRAHAAEQEAVFAVGFLRASPQWVAQDVHRRCKQHGLASRHHLVAHGLADAEFEIHIEGRATGRRHWEHGGVAVRGTGGLDGGVEIHAARAVAEGVALDSLCGVVGLAEDVVPVPCR